MNNLSKYLQLLILIFWIINVATALPMPTFPIVHGQVNGLLSAGKATSIKPTKWFTATIQAVEKGKIKKKDASYIILSVHNRGPSWDHDSKNVSMYYDYNHDPEHEMQTDEIKVPTCYDHDISRSRTRPRTRLKRSFSV